MSLSEHPSHFNKITWEGLYVALSRVKLRDDVRLLLRNGDRSTMKYISKLEKNSSVKAYFKGYVPKTCHQNSNVFHPNQVPMSWNASLALEAAGFC
mgnify:CR=1 FL=1